MKETRNMRRRSEARVEGERQADRPLPPKANTEGPLAPYTRAATGLFSVVALVLSGLSYWETARQADVAELSLKAQQQNDAYATFMKVMQESCRAMDLSNGYRAFTFYRLSSDVYKIKYATQLNPGGDLREAVDPSKLERQADTLRAAADDLDTWFSDSESEPFRAAAREAFFSLLDLTMLSQPDPQRYFLEFVHCRVNLKRLSRWGAQERDPMAIHLVEKQNVSATACAVAVPEFSSCKDDT